MLVAKARAGDGQAFTQLYERYLDRVYRYVAYRVRGREEAEDVTSQVFLRALESLDSYRWRGLPFSAWLFRIAHNLVVDRVRQAKRREVIPLEDTLPAAGLGVEEQAALNIKMSQVKEALDYLTEAQRQAVILRLVAGLSLEETAKALGKSTGAVKALQHDGLRALRHRLGQKDVAEGLT